MTTAKASIIEGLGDGFTDDKPLQTAGGAQQATIISEPAVTFLVSRSNTETARMVGVYVDNHHAPHSKMEQSKRNNHL